MKDMTKEEKLAIGKRVIDEDLDSHAIELLGVELGVHSTTIYGWRRKFLEETPGYCVDVDSHFEVLCAMQEDKIARLEQRISDLTARLESQGQPLPLWDRRALLTPGVLRPALLVAPI